MAQERRLRVAFVDQTGDESGGAQESFALLLAHLPPWIDINVILFHDGKFARRLRACGFKIAIMPVSDAMAASRRESIKAGGLLAVPGAIARLAHFFGSRQIDVVYTHTVKAHFIAAPAARLVALPCVMHLRDILDGPALAALRAVSRMCSSDQVAISRSVARAYGLNEGSVVLNPLDLEAYKTLPSREEACARLGIAYRPGCVTAGIVGRINRWKGHDRFLRIAAAVRREIDARFLIVGSAVFRDADFADELRAMTRTLGLEEHVTFVQWQDDIRDVYAALDVNVNCSSREPFGRTAIEAAACGVPTVCFSDAGVSEVITDGIDGRIVRAGDEEAFARALAGALREGAQQGMRDAASRLAQRFDAKSHALRLASIFSRAAA